MRKTLFFISFTQLIFYFYLYLLSHFCTFFKALSRSRLKHNCRKFCLTVRLFWVKSRLLRLKLHHDYTPIYPNRRTRLSPTLRSNIRGDREKWRNTSEMHTGETQEYHTLTKNVSRTSGLVPLFSLLLLGSILTCGNSPINGSSVSFPFTLFFLFLL